jgi:TonB family protein
MTIQQPRAGHGSKRLLISLLIAVLLHATAFIMLQWVFTLKQEETPDYSGPIYVTFEDLKPAPVRAPATAPTEVREETAAPAAVQEQETTQSPEKPRAFIEAPVRIDAGKASRTAPPEVFRKSQYPPTTQQAAKEEPVQGISDITTPKVEQETIPFGTDVPVTEETPEQKPAIPPEFLEKKEEQKPLLFNVNRLDTMLKEKKNEQVMAEGETSKTAESTAGGEASTQKGPVITWEEPGEKRFLQSKIERPVVPEWVKQEGLNLSVVVSFAVTPDGHTIPIKVEQSSGYTDVDSSVLDAVRKLKFNPVSVERNVIGRINYLIKTR